MSPFIAAPFASCPRAAAGSSFVERRTVEGTAPCRAASLMLAASLFLPRLTLSLRSRSRRVNGSSPGCTAPTAPRQGSTRGTGRARGSGSTCRSTHGWGLRGPQAVCGGLRLLLDERHLIFCH